MINLLTQVFLASLNSTIFFILLLSFKREIVRFVGARWYYYLWFTLLIPWISILLPFDFTLMHSPHLKIPDFDNDFYDFLIQFNFSITHFIIYCWLSGAVLTLFYLSFTHIRFILQLNNTSAPLNREQQKIAKSSLKNKNLIPLSRIYITPLLNSPMICHVIHSRIYLPQDFFSRYNASEQSYVLHHECIHFQRCDLIANAVMLILLSLNWFNPFLIFAYKHFRGAQELSCDAILSQQYSQFDSKAYGYALLKTAVSESSQSTFSCPWNMGSQLKERFLSMKLHQVNPLKNLFGIVLVVIFSSIAMAAPSLENHMIFEDLHISNFSNHRFYVTAHYQCANKLTEIKENSVTLISQSQIQRICRWPCTIVFYSDNTCSKEPIASVGLNIQGAITSIKVDRQFNVSGKDYSLLFYGHFIPNANSKNVVSAVRTQI